MELAFYNSAQNQVIIHSHRICLEGKEAQREIDCLENRMLGRCKSLGGNVIHRVPLFPVTLETQKAANKIRIGDCTEPTLWDRLAFEGNFIARKAKKDFNQYRLRKIINTIHDHLRWLQLFGGVYHFDPILFYKVRITEMSITSVLLIHMLDYGWEIEIDLLWHNKVDNIT